MGISDWSSDVCSSDLLADPGGDAAALFCAEHDAVRQRQHGDLPLQQLVDGSLAQLGEGLQRAFQVVALAEQRLGLLIGSRDHQSHRPAAPRSEEHTSELQSLMRSSYAVFCLKNKKTNQTIRSFEEHS